jgi:glycosyltransferase involved in cell wall biosynthesis
MTYRTGFNASIVVRTKNEETWIGHCLKSISTQKNVNFEIILVDNESTDETLEIVDNFDVKILKIKDFLPGRALNMGFNQSQGEFVVCISGHCVPTDDFWLEKLICEFDDPEVAGVYGRQLPLSYSSDIDKRDLLTVFGLDKKMQTKDPFFHNANSAIRKSVWDKIPFDELVTNVEDRIWGKKIIESGYKLVYTPDAKVYHWHGINHDANPTRAAKVMGVLEKAGVYSFDEAEPNPKPEYIPICILPIRSTDIERIGKGSISKLIELIRFHFVEQYLVILTDYENISNLYTCEKVVVVNRDDELVPDYIEIFEVLAESEPKVLEAVGEFSHWILFNGNFPFRDWLTLKQEISNFDSKYHNSLVVVSPILHSIWTQSSSEQLALFEWQKVPPNAIKNDSMYASLFGYGSIISRDFIKNYGKDAQKVKMSILSNKLSALELKSDVEWSVFRERMGI